MAPKTLQSNYIWRRRSNPDRAVDADRWTTRLDHCITTRSLGPPDRDQLVNADRDQLVNDRGNGLSDRNRDGGFTDRSVDIPIAQSPNWAATDRWTPPIAQSPNLAVHRSAGECFPDRWITQSVGRSTQSVWQGFWKNILRNIFKK